MNHHASNSVASPFLHWYNRLYQIGPILLGGGSEMRVSALTHRLAFAHPNQYRAERTNNHVIIDGLGWLDLGRPCHRRAFLLGIAYR